MCQASCRRFQRVLLLMPRRLAALVWFIFSSSNTREMISFIIASKGWCRSRESSERVLWLAEDKSERIVRTFSAVIYWPLEWIASCFRIVWNWAIPYSQWCSCNSCSASGAKPANCIGSSWFNSFRQLRAMAGIQWRELKCKPADQITQILGKLIGSN